MKTMMELISVPVSEEHARKVLSYVELARSEGATVECGGERVIISGTGTV
jgi:acyl-CoA reductase-like NAD-dependent aldehyde dehydrogenase